MRKTTIATLLMMLMAAALLGCGGKKRNAVYYEQMVDSIRRAEQVAEMYRKAGMYNTPQDAFFDTLARHTLPITSERPLSSDDDELSEVPRLVAPTFGLSPDARLLAVGLPKTKGWQVVLVTQQADSLEPARTLLYTMDKRHVEGDHLVVAQEQECDASDDFGKKVTEYYITSNYQITLITSFHPLHGGKTRLLDTHRYTISREGRFEEMPLEPES